MKSRGNNIWVVGAQGLILHSTDRGNTWNIRESGINTDLYSVSFPDDLHGWAVGDYGYVLRTTNGGVNWQMQQQLNPRWTYGIFFLDSLYGWACGATDTVYKTNDGGSTWVKLPQGQPNHGTSVVFVDTLRGWLSIDTGAAGILKTTDGGQTWRFILGSGTQFQSLDMLDTLTGWGAGGDIAKTTDGWNTWTVQYSPPVSLNGISIGNTLTIWTAGYGRTIISTSNGGTTWVVDSSTTSVINNYYAVDGHLQLTNVTVVGDGGAIIRSTNSGNTWRVFRNVDIGNTSLLNVTFRDANRGWAVGTYGMVTYTTNGGTVWQRQIPNASGFIWGVSFADSLHGKLCTDAGEISGTRDGGNVWAAESSGALYPLWRVDLVDTSFGVAVGGGYGPEPPKGEVHGSMGAGEQGGKDIADWRLRIADFRTNNQILRYTQNDSLKQILPPDRVRGQHDSLRAWGTGSDFWKWPWRPEEMNPQIAYRTITRTTNGGALWIAQNTTDQVPLYGVSFVSPSEGWTCGDPQGGMGVILHTTDSGATWTGQSSNVNQTFNWIQFKDRLTGWCVGGGGTTLWTTDGGATWNQGNSGTTAFLWSCAFYDNLHGFACADNGLLIKTTDGGRNWTPDTSEVYANLEAVNALDSLHAWTVGSYGIVLGWNEAGVSGVETTKVGRRQLAGGRLEQSYPNPMRDNCAISYWLSANSSNPRATELSIYDVTGRRIRFFAPLRMTEGGRHTVVWDGRDETGKNVPAGVYFYQLRTKEITETKKLVKIQ